MGKCQTQVFEVIRLMCHTHGEVSGVRALSAALGHTYQSTYTRVRKLHARGLIAAHWPGKGGQPVRIWMN